MKRTLLANAIGAILIANGSAFAGTLHEIEANVAFVRFRQPGLPTQGGMTFLPSPAKGEGP